MALRSTKRNTALAEAQKNPFMYGRPISLDEDLADREEEKRALVADALSGQPMMHAPDMTMHEVPGSYGSVSAPERAHRRAPQGFG
jgi:hypothetical protein